MFPKDLAFKIQVTNPPCLCRLNRSWKYLLHVSRTDDSRVQNVFDDRPFDDRSEEESAGKQSVEPTQFYSEKNVISILLEFVKIENIICLKCCSILFSTKFGMLTRLEDSKI